MDANFIRNIVEKKTCVTRIRSIFELPIDCLSSTMTFTILHEVSRELFDTREGRLILDNSWRIRKPPQMEMMFAPT
jgi:hypothetical protein